MKFSRLTALIALSFLFNPVQAAEDNTLPECKVALRLITSPDYIRDHQGEIPDANTMDENAKVSFVANLFKENISKADQQEQFCTATIRDNLGYTNAYHLPHQCVEFLPLLKKSFEDKVSYKKDLPNFARLKMEESIVDMLILDETAPERLVQRCEVGTQVMHVNLNDKHLKQKYPLPPACEALFDDMEKSVILPSELETIRRQRVIFAIENKDTPKKLVDICEEISK